MTGSPRSTRRTWVAEPELGDRAVLEATGRRWDDWCDLIDASPVAEADHPAIARHLTEDHGLDGWWAQAVTVGYERITGRRLPGQRSDGTFAASRSATIAGDADALRARLLDDAERAALFPGQTTTLRSRPTSKNLRIAMGSGVAELSLAPRTDGRVTVTVQHHQLASPDEVAHWKAFWGDWLADLPRTLTDLPRTLTDKDRS